MLCSVGMKVLLSIMSNMLLHLSRHKMLSSSLAARLLLSSFMALLVTRGSLVYSISLLYIHVTVSTHLI